MSYVDVINIYLRLQTKANLATHGKSKKKQYILNKFETSAFCEKMSRSDRLRIMTENQCSWIWHGVGTLTYVTGI